METKFQTIYRYAREALDNSQIRETALAMIAHIAKDEIAEPQLTEAESQLVLGAMPLQGLSNECAFIHVLPSGSMRCGALREHHSQYTGHEFTEPQPAPKDGEWSLSKPLTNQILKNQFGSSCKVAGIDVTNDKGRVHYGQVIVFDSPEIAKQIVRDHQLAALVPGLIEALEDMIQYPYDQLVNSRARAAIAKSAALTTASKEQHQ